MRLITLLLVVVPLCAQTKYEQTRYERPKYESAYFVSQVVLVGATTADIHSSYGHWEANPLLRDRNGRFGSKGIAIKCAVVGGVLLFQKLLNKRGRHNKLFAITNLAVGTSTGGVAARNYLHRRPRP